jgi:hypothetical protein
MKLSQRDRAPLEPPIGVKSLEVQDIEESKAKKLSCGGNT